METIDMRFLTGILFVFASIIATAQNGSRQVTTQEVMWLHFSTNYEVAKWNFTGEVEERFYLSPVRQHQFFAPRLTAAYKWSQDWSAGVGGSYFSHSQPFDPDAEINVNVPEIRPHADLNFKTNLLGKLGMKNRLRLEPRFIHRHNGENLLNGYDQLTRLRYLAMFKLPISNTFALKAGAEIFINTFGDVDFNYFDHNRIIGGVNISLSDHTNLDLLYINWYQLRGDNSYFNRHIGRVTFQYTI